MRASVVRVSLFLFACLLAWVCLAAPAAAQDGSEAAGTENYTVDMAFYSDSSCRHILGAVGSGGASSLAEAGACEAISGGLIPGITRGVTFDADADYNTYSMALWSSTRCKGKHIAYVNGSVGRCAKVSPSVRYKAGAVPRSVMLKISSQEE